MNTRRWQRISDVLERALDLDAPARRELYASECADDPTIADEVERLVFADTGARKFLVVPRGKAAAPTARPLAAGARVGGYTLVRRVAAGGMGVVFEARQERPNRRVAVKLVQSVLVDEATLRRFRYEAEVLGRLRHPGIAQVYEAGIDVDPEGGDRPFLAMEFVEGARPITVHARESALRYEQIAALFVEVCAAVQHGHERGVLHRDLKASNVLVDAAGHVKVIDFGIARVLGDQQTRATLAGELVGTLSSMAPEQLDGDVDAVDVRSDVYALGALLYEMLCGVPPVELRGLSLSQALAKARDSSPASPTSVRADVPRELEWIVLRALEPDRDRRYPSAAEFARDLERFLGDEPVLASPPSTVYLVRKFVRRNRVVVAAAAAVATALLGGALIALVQRDRAVEAREIAVEAKERAEHAEELAVDRLARLEAEARTNRELAEFQGDMLKSVDPDVDGRDARVVDVLARASAGLDARTRLDPRLELALRRSIAEAYGAIGLPREAEQQIRRMVPLWEAHYAPTDPARLALERLRMENDAFLAPARDREVRARDGLARATTATGADSVETAQWTLALCVALADLGRPEEAEPHARPAVEVLRTELGPASKEALDGSLVVGRVLNDSKRLAEAEAWKRESYELCLAVLGEERVETLRAKKQLAFAIGQNGRVDEAVAMLREVVDAHARRTGAHSASALTARADLAEFLRRARHYGEALVEIESAIADGRAALGERHPFVFQSRQRRGSALMSLGRREEAIAELHSTLDDARAELGDDDATTLEVQEGLVRLLYGSSRFEEALPHARACWEGSRRTLGDDSATTLARANSYAVLLSETKRLAEAIPVFDFVLEGQDRLLGPLHTQSLTTISNLSTSLLNAGQPEIATCRAEEFVERVRSKPDAKRSEIAGASWALGRARRALGDHETAAACFALAADQWSRSGEATSRSAIGVLLDESISLDALGRHDESRLVLAQAATLAFDPQTAPDMSARAVAMFARAIQGAGDVEGARDLALFLLGQREPLPAPAREIAEDLVNPR